MAFDQNSTLLGLRPLDVAALVAEEPLFSPATVTPPTPNSIGELFYKSSASAMWCVCPIVHTTVSPAAATTFGFNYDASSFSNRVVAGNALNLGKLLGCNGLDKAFNDANGFGYGVGGVRGNGEVAIVGDHGGGSGGGGGEEGGVSVQFWWEDIA